MNQFAERYKTLSHSDLLVILLSADDYQPEAVEAAKVEIASRNLPAGELEAAQNEATAAMEEKQNKKDKKEAVENKVKDFGQKAFDSVNPIQKSQVSTEKLISIIALIFGLISIYKWYKYFGMIIFIFTEGSLAVDTSVIAILAELFLIPVAAIWFWLRKTNGWILLASILTYHSLYSLAMMITFWNMEPTGMGSIESLFPTPSKTSLLLGVIFFTGLLGVLLKPEIRKRFVVSQTIMIATLTTVGVLTTISIAALFIR